MANMSARPTAPRLARTSDLSMELASGLVSDPSWAMKLARGLGGQCTLEVKALGLPSVQMMAPTWAYAWVQLMAQPWARALARQWLLAWVATWARASDMALVPKKAVGSASPSDQKSATGTATPSGRASDQWSAPPWEY